MRAIYKQVLAPKSRHSCRMQINNIEDIKSVINQNEDICLYYLHDSDCFINNTVDIIILGTGHEINTDIENFNQYTFIDTVSLANGSLIFHIFAKIV